MGLIGMGFLIGSIVTVAIVSILMNSKQDEKPQEKYKREISLSEMLTVVNYFYHFGRATTYEKEVMEALMTKLKEEMQ